MQQQPAKQGWWSSLSDGQRYAIIGGAAVGVLAIGTGIVLLARKPKAVANAQQSKRYGYATGKHKRFAAYRQKKSSSKGRSGQDVRRMARQAQAMAEFGEAEPNWHGGYRSKPRFRQTPSSDYAVYVSTGGEAVNVGQPDNLDDAMKLAHWAHGKQGGKCRVKVMRISDWTEVAAVRNATR
jgi:hypothetical protein